MTTTEQEPMKLDGMDRDTRRRLLAMACVAAWSDLEVQDEEREVILDLASELALGEEGRLLAKRWLNEGPPEVDPYEVPHEHRAAFFQALARVIESDGRIDPRESETLRLLRELIA